MSFLKELLQFMLEKKEVLADTNSTYDGIIRWLNCA